MAKTIPAHIGIYDTQYTLIKHRDGTLSVKVPYIKWVNQLGSLAFKKVKIERHAALVVSSFEKYDGNYDFIWELLSYQPDFRNL
jgi:hypothetical protein